MPNPILAFLPRVRTVAYAAVALARDRLRIIDVATRRPAEPPSASVRAHTTDGTGTVEALYRELAAHRAREARMQLGALLEHPDRLLAQSASALEDAAGALQHAAATHAPSGDRTGHQLDLQANGLLTVAACFEAAADLQRRH